ncbi:hypothetical protein RN001_008732 [Aquatica leii]|uniref:Uncharacterized protein n=1 Tax=Aquatica leii TaxID=1421715 RepID=A0AAN7PDP9_9COLE|nr:hypothetical protein RN001_008732 [Aquatica leii]
MINAIYGKCMENVRKHRDIHLVTKWDGRWGVRSLISKPNFHSSVVFDEDMVIVEMNKLEIFKQSKIVLSPYDDKRMLSFDSTDTRPWGCDSKGCNITMMDVGLQIALEAQQAKEKVYEKYLKNAIRFNVTDSAKETLAFLLKKENFVVPSDIISFAALYGNKLRVDDLCQLLDKRRSLDNYVNNIVSVCKTEKCESINLNKLDDILVLHSLERNISFKLYILKLLSNFNIINACHLNYPVQNILKNHKDIKSCIDECICNASYLADVQILKKFITALICRNICFKFNPSENEKHAEILLWIQKNISKGTHHPDAVLGWTSGPDSAKWPSTNLEDYKETLSYLMLITH